MNSSLVLSLRILEFSYHVERKGVINNNKIVINFFCEFTHACACVSKTMCKQRTRFLFDEPNLKYVLENQSCRLAV